MTDCPSDADKMYLSAQKREKSKKHKSNCFPPWRIVVLVPRVTPATFGRPVDRTNLSHADLRFLNRYAHMWTVMIDPVSSKIVQTGA